MLVKVIISRISYHIQMGQMKQWSFGLNETFHLTLTAVSFDPIFSYWTVLIFKSYVNTVFP